MRHNIYIYIGILVFSLTQLLFFGYILNNNPKNLPTVIVNGDHGPVAKVILKGLENTGYFKIVDQFVSDAEANELLISGKAVFSISIPENFSHDLIRGRQPHILLEGDAIDWLIVSGGFTAAKTIAPRILNRDLQGSLSYLLPTPQSFILDVHPKFNPANIFEYFSVPSLSIIFLNTVMILLSSLVISREYQDGTMETLLATPVKPLEIIIGKVIPQLVFAFILLILFLLTSYWIFSVPFLGNKGLLLLLSIPFLLAVLGMGIVLSIISFNIVIAAVCAILYNLFTLLFSGLVFPFRGMPIWAQHFGDILPSTHYFRIFTIIELKNGTFMDVWPQVWPILIFLIFIYALADFLYRRTLD